MPLTSSFAPADKAAGHRPRGLFRALNRPIRDWRGQRVWIVGASSGIGEALARALAARGARLALSARREDALRGLSADVCPDALVLPLDVTDAGSVGATVARIEGQWGGIDLVIWLAGTYAPMRAQDFDLSLARAMLDANLGGALNGVAALVPLLRRQGGGGLALVSSVAGYRGLPKSIAYGPGKAAVINLAESLWLDLSGEGIGIWLVNPGFVATPLTADNDFPMPGLLTPEQAADAMIRGFATGRFEIHFPKRFTLWMQLLRLLPDRIYFAAVRRITGL